MCNSCTSSRPPARAPTWTHRPAQQLLPCPHSTPAGSWGSAYWQTHPWSPDSPGWAELRSTPFLPDLGRSRTHHRMLCAPESTCECAGILSPAATSCLQPLNTIPEFAKPQPRGTAQPPQSPESSEGGGPFHNKSPTHFWPAEAAWSQGSGVRKERVPQPPPLPGPTGFSSWAGLRGAPVEPLRCLGAIHGPEPRQGSLTLTLSSAKLQEDQSAIGTSPVALGTVPKGSLGGKSLNH